MTRETRQDGGEYRSINYFKKRLPNEVKKKAYEDYYRHALFYLENLGEKERTRKDRVIDAIPGDVKDATKWRHARKVQAVSPDIAFSIVDAFPTGSVLVCVSAQRIDIDPEQIPQSQINKIQQECEEFGSEFRQQHADYFLANYQTQAEECTAVDLENSNAINVEQYEQVQAKLRYLVVEKYRDELVSLDQAMTSSAGSANEELAKCALEDAGLEENDGFENVSQKGWDLTVRTDAGQAKFDNSDELYVEVKSTRLRERAVKGMADTDDPTVLFGFFNELDELKGKVEELKKRSALIYVPPPTLKKDSQLNSSDTSLEDYMKTVNGKEYRYVRENTRFGDDMLEFYETGDLPAE
jgi:hypothetical protein